MNMGELLTRGHEVITMNMEELITSSYNQF